MQLATGVKVYGGFAPNWRPATTGETTIVGRPEAVSAVAVSNTGLERVTLHGERDIARSGKS